MRRQRAKRVEDAAPPAFVGAFKVWLALASSWQIEWPWIVTLLYPAGHA
jgi:hypothetical protein